MTAPGEDANLLRHHAASTNIPRITYNRFGKLCYLLLKGHLQGLGYQTLGMRVACSTRNVSADIFLNGVKTQNTITRYTARFSWIHYKVLSNGSRLNSCQ